MKTTIIIALCITIAAGCFNNSEKPVAKKIVQSIRNYDGYDSELVEGFYLGSIAHIKSRPRSILLTGNKNHRLTPIFQLTYQEDEKNYYAGSISFYSTYSEDEEEGNNRWNNHLMPGFEAVYGYNLINISHYNIESKQQQLFFDSAVLINTLYYPSLSKDTLNKQLVKRDYYMISAYNEDTNRDSIIDRTDLRRFYYFDVNAQNPKVLIPDNYSVISSEYDPENDAMYIFARLDENKNGQMEVIEAIHVFWIDLKNPQNTGILYKKE